MYKKFLTLRKPRAFVIAHDGAAGIERCNPIMGKYRRYF